MKHIGKRSTTIGLALLLIGVTFLLTGRAIYDLQLLLYGFLRISLLFLAVWLYYEVKLYDDDVQEDWQRINDGNLAVAVFRAAEFSVVVGSSALFLYKI